MKWTKGYDQQNPFMAFKIELKWKISSLLIFTKKYRLVLLWFEFLQIPQNLVLGYLQHYTYLQGRPCRNLLLSLLFFLYTATCKIEQPVNSSTFGKQEWTEFWYAFAYHSIVIIQGQFFYVLYVFISETRRATK